ncbi:MAG: hypothetical protein HND54_07955 [Bacteroidetes bacterium]|nr:hypothetical protein [Bacteroidota bacterium]
MVKVSLSQLSIVICSVIIASLVLSNKHWRNDDKIISNDVISYYGYLPAIFIYQDASLAYWDRMYPSVKQKIWFKNTKNDGRVFIKTIGVSYFYMPFFVLAHQLSNQFGYLNNGYTKPYRLAIVLSSFLFYILGLVFVRKILLNYFNENVTAITILIVSIGTNIVNYVVHEPGMSHVFSFFSIAVFFYYAIKWHQVQSSKYLFILGVMTGLIILIQPINITVLLFFLFMGIRSFPEFKQRLRLFVNNYKQVIYAILGCLLVIIPQLLYWKYNTGDWFFCLNPEESYFFHDSKLLNGLFGFRKGWLIYTPLMSLAMIGLFLRNDIIQKYKSTLLLFLTIHLYITFSWWCWWYGGSFGMRALIDIYPLLIIPIGVLVNYILKLSYKIKVPFLVLIALLVGLNFFQNEQYIKGSLHYDSMTFQAFTKSFGTLNVDNEYYELLVKPDYEKAIKGER